MSSDPRVVHLTDYPHPLNEAPKIFKFSLEVHLHSPGYAYDCLSLTIAVKLTANLQHDMFHFLNHYL